MNALCSCIFIGVDVLTGLFAAIHDRTLDSSVMREGFFNKSAEILAVFLSWIIEYTLKETEVAEHIPMYSVTCIYISAMEIVSSLENLCCLNPKLRKLCGPYLKKLNEWQNKEGG